jgi:hypothetical protein
MNAFQKANFLQVSKSGSSDLVFDKILNHLNSAPSKDHSLIWQQQPIEVYFQSFPTTPTIPENTHTQV